MPLSRPSSMAGLGGQAAQMASAASFSNVPVVGAVMRGLPGGAMQALGGGLSEALSIPGGVLWRPTPPLLTTGGEEKQEKCEVTWSVDLIVTINGDFALLAAGGKAPVSAEEGDGVRRYVIPWSVGSQMIPKEQNCTEIIVEAPDELPITLQCRHGGDRSRPFQTTAKVVKKEHPFQVGCCDEPRKFIFEYDATDVPCTGSYYVVLFLQIVNGHLGRTQQEKLTKSFTGGEIDNATGETVGLGTGSPDPVLQDQADKMFGPGNGVAMWFGLETRPCGEYEVTVSAQSECATSIGNFVDNGPTHQVEIHCNDLKPVQFKGIIDLAQCPMPDAPGGGAGGAGGAGEGEGAPPPFEEAPASFNGGAIGYRSIPFDLGAEAGLQSESLNGMLEPSQAVFGMQPRLDIRFLPGMVNGGPPWTQMDIILDPAGNIDSGQAIVFQDINGRNVVRGWARGRWH